MTQTPPISAEQVEAAARALSEFDWSVDSAMTKADWADSNWRLWVDHASAALNAAASIPASRGVETSHDWAGGNDTCYCRRGGIEYAYGKEPKPSGGCPASPALPVQEQEPHVEHGEAVGVTYYAEGKDADWFEALDDETFATRIAYAGMDIADGDFSNIENCMPVVAMLTLAADRIRRLLRSEAQAVGNEDTIIARAEAADKRIATLEAALTEARSDLLGSGFVGPSPDGVGDPEINRIDAALKKQLL